MAKKGKNKSSHGVDAQESRQDIFFAELKVLFENGRLATLLKEYGFAERAQPASPALNTLAPAADPSASTPVARWSRANKKKADEQNWKEVIPKKKELVADQLDAAGWSVPVVARVTDLKIGSPGLALASATEAQRAVREMKCTGSMAILSTVNVDNLGVEIPASVKDMHGRPVQRKRYLIQLGTVPVTYTPTASRGGTVSCPGTGKIVVQFVEKHTISTFWSAALKNPKAAAAHWLRDRAKAEILELLPPTSRVESGTLQVVAIVSKASIPEILKMSGRDGLFARRFFQNDMVNPFEKIVPLPTGTTLDSALRIADTQSHGLGVVCIRIGLGLRVPGEKFEQSTKLIHGTDAGKFLGKKWVISGIPFDWYKEAVLAFLGDWNVEIVFQQRIGSWRNWTVRASTEPPAKRLAHNQGESVISEEIPQARVSLEPVRRWAPQPQTRKQNASPIAFVSGGPLITGLGFAGSAVPNNAGTRANLINADRAPTPANLIIDDTVITPANLINDNTAQTDIMKAITNLSAQMATQMTSLEILSSRIDEVCVSVETLKQDEEMDSDLEQVEPALRTPERRRKSRRQV